MEGYIRKPRRDTVHREVWGVQDRSRRRIEVRERLALLNRAKEEEHLDIYGGLRDRNENVLARPKELRENAETAISCRGPRLAMKIKEVYQQSTGGGRRCTDVLLWQSSRE